MKSTLEKLIAGINLSKAESYDLFSKLMQAPIEQQAAVLALFAAKGESVEELLGAREFLFEQTTPVNFEFDVIDIVGTGGDNKGTFNISTAASLVIASCGVYVAKHGGRSTTSQSGSTDLLENLGFSLATTPIEIKQSLEKHHYAYLSAPLFNPAFKALSTLRKNLGFPTLFNFLGPLLNPINPKKTGNWRIS